MSIIDRTPSPHAESVAFEIDLAHAPEKVWRALTEPALLAEWLLPVLHGTLPLEPGSAFTFKIDPPQPRWEGIVHCTVLAVEQYRTLSYTWVVDDLDTVVTFTLTPTASGTRLSIRQAGFKPDQKQYFGGARYGWKLMGGKLVELLQRVA